MVSAATRSKICRASSLRPLQRVIVRQPERARQEGAFSRWEPVNLARTLVHRVAEQETVMHQVLFDRGDSTSEPADRGRQETDEREQQQAGVDLARSRHIV